MPTEQEHTDGTKQSALIRRLITNQRNEHTPHAFRAGHAGMHDFNRLVPTLRRLPANEIRTWLDLIDEVADSHRDCVYCLGKISAYRILITKDIEALAPSHANYVKQYTRLLAEQNGEDQRDFIREVLNSMHHGQEHPHRKLYAFHWHELAESIRSEGRHQLDKESPFLSRNKTQRSAV